MERKNKMQEMKYPPFSVAMSVYAKDNAEWFDSALGSIINQTVKPDEIVLIVDGPVPASIQKVIDKYMVICISGRGVVLKVVKLPENKGLGYALRIAVDKCNHEIIARMDSDDIAVNIRFETQLQIMAENPDIDIVGGDIVEFIDEIDHKVGKRSVPIPDERIKEYMKKRCPFNHMTVMYRKDAVQKAGGYKDLFWNEDYFLWIRMAELGCKMANTGTILVNVRVGTDMYKRRGGKEYFASELFLQKYMLQRKMIDGMTFVGNILKRFTLQVLIPNQIRGWVFRNFARERV